MTQTDLNKLRQYYHSILSQKTVFDNCSDPYIEHYPVNILNQEIDRIISEFPDLIPPFKMQDFFSYDVDGSNPYYSINGIRSYLSTVIARLKIAIDTPQNTPVTEKREFSFLNNADLKNIIERDYSEIQRAFISVCWKSVIILCGGAIEAILTDLLLSNSSNAIASNKAPKGADITKWSLANLIEVSVDINLVSPSIEKLSHSIREYRNLVHPGREIRERLIFDSEEAKIALEVLHILHRELS